MGTAVAVAAAPKQATNSGSNCCCCYLSKCVAAKAKVAVCGSTEKNLEQYKIILK